MTKAQVDYILDKVGISTGKWLGKELKTQFIQISLSQDSNIFVSPETYRYKFNDSKEVIEIVVGSENEDETIFTSEAGDTSDYTATAVIPYSMIYSFVSQ